MLLPNKIIVYNNSYSPGNMRQDWNNNREAGIVSIDNKKQNVKDVLEHMCHV